MEREKFLSGREKHGSFASSSGAGGSPFGGMISVTIKSPQISLKTWVDPEWSVSEAANRIRKKFSEEATEYILYLESSNSFLLLDTNSKLNSFKELEERKELIFREKGFQGTKEKPLKFAGSAKQEVNIPSDQIDIDEDPPEYDSLIENTNASQKTRTFSDATVTKHENSKLGEFFSSLIETCKLVLKNCMHIKHLVSNTQSSDTGIFEAARTTAQGTMDLINLVNSQESLKADPAYHLVKQGSASVRTKVLSLIQASRDRTLNPLNFNLMQAFNEASKEVADAIKELIESANELQTEGASSNQNEEEAQLVKSLIENTQQLSIGMNAISTAVDKHDADTFIAAARTLVSAMNVLLETDQKQEIGKYWDLKAATQAFVGAAKTNLKQADAAQKNLFGTSKQALADLVRTFLVAVSKKSWAVKKALRDHQFVSDFAPKDETEEKDYRIKKQTAMKITNMLTSKFELFQKQWTQQTPVAADLVLDQIVDILTLNGFQIGAKTQGTPQAEENVQKPMDSEEQAMTELAKIMKMKDAGDWQQMALNIRRVTARLDISRGKLDTEEKELDSANLPEQLKDTSNIVKNTALEFVLTLSDTLLDAEEQKLGDAKEKNPIAESTGNFLKALRKSALLSKVWLRPNAHKKSNAKENTSSNVKKTWAIRVECSENKITFVKKLKLDVNLTGEEIVAKIVNKLPIEKQRDYGLYIPSEQKWLKNNKKLLEYPQFASEKLSLQLKELDSKEGNQKQTISNMIDSVIQLIEKCPTKGQKIGNIIGALRDNSTGEFVGNYMSVKLKLEDSLQDKIYNQLNAIRVLGVQLISALQTLSRVASDMKDYTSLLQVISISRQIVPVIEDLLNSFETYNYLRNLSEKSIPHVSSKFDPAKMLEEDDIWKEGLGPILDEKGNLKGGTLNSIVIQLTNEEKVDSQFLTTFMTTYQSFTTPYVVLQKLMQRYNVPEDKFDEDKIAKMRLRIGIVLKYWMQNQFEDFDKKTISALSHFINTTLTKENVNLSKFLGAELEKKKSDMKAQNRSKYLELHEFKLPDDTRSPAELFLVLNESEIARQLTIIEFKPSELMNQSWNKPKLQHRAPHIIAMISRSNKLALWVGSIILWFAKCKDRSKVLTKLINVAEHLRSMHNYNTTFGLLAGMSMSAVSRLNHTWNDLNPQARETFQQLQDLFHPSFSFKKYRTELAQASAKGAVLPYLGTYLSDLTFTEDGNSDYLSGDMINWSKRQLVSKIVNEIQNQQQQGFEFPVVEPIHTFLTELPHLEDDELYDLSLLREPRGAELKDLE